MAHAALSDGAAADRAPGIRRRRHHEHLAGVPRVCAAPAQGLAQRGVLHAAEQARDGLLSGNPGRRPVGRMQLRPGERTPLHQRQQYPQVLHAGGRAGRRVLSLPRDGLSVFQRSGRLPCVEAALGRVAVPRHGHRRIPLAEAVGRACRACRQGRSADRHVYGRRLDRHPWRAGVHRRHPRREVSRVRRGYRRDALGASARSGRIRDALRLRGGRPAVCRHRRRRGRGRAARPRATGSRPLRSAEAAAPARFRAIAHLAPRFFGIF